MSWTDDRVELLKKLWIDGHSASQIAAQLGGVTRNAVIGKVHRLGLSGRGKTTNRTTTPRAKPARATRPATERPRAPSAPTIGATALKIEPDAAPALAPAPVERSADVTTLPPKARKLSIMALNERVCKWPIGDPTSADFHFCGCDAQPGIPYCTYHAKLAYQPASDRRRERKTATG
ncbi:MAG: GcrA family cell cycle regulator [Pseudomonadota bacterium]